MTFSDEEKRKLKEIRERREAVAKQKIEDSKPPPVTVVKSTAQTVRVVGLDIPFAQLVMLLVKVTLAAIPALIILVIVLGALAANALLLAGALGLIASH